MNEESAYSDEIVRRAARHVATSYHEPVRANTESTSKRELMYSRRPSTGSIMEVLQRTVSGDSMPSSPDTSPRVLARPHSVPKLVFSESPARSRLGTDSATSSPGVSRCQTPVDRSPKEEKSSPKGLGFVRKMLHSGSSEDVRKELAEQSRKISRIEADMEFLKNAMTKLLKNNQ